MGRVQDDPEAPGTGGKEPTPSCKSKSQQLHVLSAWLGDRSGETETNLTPQPQPVGRWGLDADPIPDSTHSK